MTLLYALAGAGTGLVLGAVVVLVVLVIRARRDPDQLWGIVLWPFIALVLGGLYGAPAGAVVGLVAGAILFPGGIVVLVPLLLVVAVLAWTAWRSWRGPGY
jgi:hypothetical protein